MYHKSAENIVEGLTGVEVTTSRDGTATYTTDQDTVSTSNKLPNNWPSDAPHYPDATIALATAVNQTSQNTDAEFSVSLSTPDDNAKVITYYKAELIRQGWEIGTNASFNSTTALDATKDKRAFSTMINPTKDGQADSIMATTVTNQINE